MYVYQCKVVKVVDGDTLDLEIDLGFNIKIKERVRLLGVDTPEVFGANAVPEGNTASDFTKSWVSNHETLNGHFEFHSKKYNYKDKYGRCLGLLIWKSIDQITEATLNNDLVTSGHIK